MKYLVALLSLVIFISSCAVMSTDQQYQLKQYRGKYEGQFEKDSKVLKQFYHHTLERTQDGKYVRKQFYPPNKQITHFETYSDNRLRTLDGKYKEWLDNGDVFIEGQFVNGKAEGEWKYYDFHDGYFESFGNFKAGKKTGLWKHLFKEGKVRAEYNFVNGKKQGAYKLFNKEGSVFEEGIYTNDELTTQNILIQPKDREEEFKIVEQMPRFHSPKCEDLTDKVELKKCGETEMLKFIYSNIKYPRFARKEGIEGKALVSFVIDKDGKVIDLKVRRGICLDISSEVSRVVGMMPNWNPGIQRDKPVKVRYNLPVKFNLQ